MPQERVRKLTEENKELANNLKKDMDAQRRAVTKPSSVSTNKKRAYGSDLTSSARGSEDRSSAVPQAPRGTKRGKETEGLDKVRVLTLTCSFLSQMACRIPTHICHCGLLDCANPIVV